MTELRRQVRGSQLERISASVSAGRSICLSTLVYHSPATCQALEDDYKMAPAHRSAPITGGVRQLHRQPQFNLIWVDTLSLRSL